MGSKTNIEWCTATWSPIVGCSKVSEACRSCYAESIAWRFKGRVPAYAEATEPRIPGPGGRWANKAVLVRERLFDPQRWREPKRIFVCSMSDIGHESLLYREIAAVLASATLCPQHKFLLLTKRPQRLVAFFEWLAHQAELDKLLFPADSYGWRIRRLLWAALHKADTGRTDIVFDSPEDGPWPLPNLWFGVTAENQEQADARIPLLLRLPAVGNHYFVSCEPLLGPVDLSPWLGYGSWGGGESSEITSNEDQMQRKTRLRGGATRTHQHRQDGTCVACGDDALEQVEDGDGVVRAPEGSCGEANDARVLAGASHGARYQVQRIGSPSRVSSCLWTNSCRDDSESQERSQGRQQAGESRVGDVQATNATLHRRAREAQAAGRTVGRTEPCSETDICRSGGCNQDARQWSDDAGDCRQVRCDDAAHIQDCATRKKVSWVIVGGETGPKARPMLDSWVDQLEIVCGEANVPFFFKGWGTWREYPTIDDPTWDAAVEAFGKGAVEHEVFDRNRIMRVIRVADVEGPGQPRVLKQLLHGERRQRVPDDLLLPGERRRA